MTRQALFTSSARGRDFHQRVAAFMDTEVRPGQLVYDEQHASTADRWSVPSVIEELKAKARQAGLWNLFLPDEAHGAGLSNLHCRPPVPLRSTYDRQWRRR